MGPPLRWRPVGDPYATQQNERAAIVQHMGSMLSVPCYIPTTVLHQPAIGSADYVQIDRTALPILGGYSRRSPRHVMCSVDCMVQLS